MNTVRMIDVTVIDPDSTINVRRQGVEENVEKVKASIQQHGYWPDQPIIVRPHPDSNSKYDYQNVTGQCRLKACLALGLEEIPAFVLELNDNESLQRSWLENEIRGDLAPSDKTYWTEKIIKRYDGDGYTTNEAIDLAAKYLGVTANTVREYYTLVVLPQDVKDMVDQRIITEEIARVLARTTYDSNPVRSKKSEQAMRDRASWIMSLERERRKHAVKALQKLGNKASIADLTAEVTRLVKDSQRVIQYVIPSELYDHLLQWGAERGLGQRAGYRQHNGRRSTERVSKILMDTNTAREILGNYAGRLPSEIGNAIEVLYPVFGTYKAIAEAFGRSDKFWNIRHRLFQLPAGIRWKVDEGQISIDQSYQISRLKNDEDQWLLAIAIIETEDLTASECGNVVNLVLKGDKSIQDALSVSAGVRSDNIQPLLLPLGFNIRLAICKRAWGQCQEWEDLVYQFILQSIDVDIKEIAFQLEKLASDMHKAGKTEADPPHADIGSLS